MVLPVVSVHESQLGPWGNQHATNWKLKVGERQDLKEITISHGFIVDRLEFTILDESGNLSTSEFGGPGGSTNKIVLKSDEYVTRISGTDAVFLRDEHPRVISSLKIHTNLNPTGYGPYGQQRDVKDTSNFSSPMPIFGRISGFFGKADRYLESIGILVTKTIEQLGPWGNEGATNWSWQLNENETIKEIAINNGFIVDGIGFTIADQSGKTSTLHFGGSGGHVDKIVLKPNEKITQLSGTDAEFRYDNDQRVISSLKIHTNLNPSGYGPYGEQRDVSNTSSFSSPMPINGIISGLFGRSGRYLSSIGIFVIKT